MFAVILRARWGLRQSPAFSKRANQNPERPTLPPTGPLRTIPAFILALCLAAGGSCFAADAPAPAPGLLYTNYRFGNPPWSIHLVCVPRSNPQYELHSMHAGGHALGLSPLSAQVALCKPALGNPEAAINGDFYIREKAYAGAPRGLQIVEGEVLSAPSGGPTFWLDVLGEPHVTNLASKFQVTWPDGTTTPFKLNGERKPDGIELYSPAVGKSTHTTGGREFVLERQEQGPWLPLRIGRTFPARVREIRSAGNTPLAPDILVLSLGPAVMDKVQNVSTGAVLQVSTASLPALRGVRTAISGGPILVCDGKRQAIKASRSDSFETSSMIERHPRTAIGWNEKFFFLVEVDGRQRDLSVGMTLEELSRFLVKLGCEDLLNLDGGGSATLWCEGQVRNSPCDGYERPIANSLVVLRKPINHDGEPRTGGPRSNAALQGVTKE
jgi:hypothetical protein